ncbi:MAG: ABC transporter ATP-binding protein [Candidatus Xenobia bacterium]
MKTVRWIWSVWTPHRVFILPLLLLTVANGVAVAAIPMATRTVIDDVASHLTATALWHSIEWLAAVGAARFVVYCTLQNLRGFVNCRLEWTARDRLFAHLVRLGPSFYVRYKIGDIVTRLTDDIGENMKLAWFLCSGLFRFLEALAVVVTVAVAMLRLNLTLALWCLFPLPFLFWLFLRIAGRLDRRYAALQGMISRVNSEIDATFGGIRVVKAFGIEATRQKAFEQVCSDRRRAELNAVRTMVALESLYGYSWQIVAAIVLLVGGLLVIHGGVTLGDFVAFNGFAVSLTFPMFDFGAFLTRGRLALVSIERLQVLEEVDADVQDGQPARADLPADLSAHEVSYRYPSGSQALRQITLEARPGTTTALVGRVGQGKSTLIRLLLRLFDPDQGRVQRGDQDVRQVALRDARAGIGYVPQEPVILSGTIRDNIRFGRDIPDEELQRAVRMAQLETDLAGFQDGLDTRVGPRGVQLSGGQKQRVSLARALAGHPRILLLDDCTASLDADTEVRLWDALAEHCADTTRIIVTHRTSELERADRIYVLGDGGRLMQQGTHQSLMQQGGEYRRLYQQLTVR